jgi:hypothetical protein
MGKRKALSLLDGNSLGRLPRLPSDSDFSSLTWQKKVLASSKTPKTSNCGGGSIVNQKPPRAAHTSSQGGPKNLSRRFVATRKRRGRRKAPSLVNRESEGGDKDESFSFQLPTFEEASPKLLCESKVDLEEEKENDKIPSIETNAGNIQAIATDRHCKNDPQAVSSTKEPSTEFCPSLCTAKESRDGTSSHMNHLSSSVQAEEDMDCGSDSDSLGMDSSTENSPARDAHSSRKVDAANNSRTKPDDDIHLPTPSHVQEEKKDDSQPQEKIRVSSAPRRVTKSPAKQDDAGHVDFPRFPQAAMQDPDPLIAADDLIQQVMNSMNSSPDNQAVLKRMMESETTNQHIPGVPFRIGSTVGGTELHRSESLDNSDVTWHTSSTLDEVRREQRISQFRAGIGGRSIPPFSPFQPSGSRSRAVLNSTASTKYFPASSGNKGKFLSKGRASAAKASGHGLESDSSVDIWYAEDDDASQTTQLTVGGKKFIHLPLPPGWQVFVSEESKRPFYFHPHYGTTWDCPTILPTKTQALAMKKGGHIQKNSLMMVSSNGEIVVAQNSQTIRSSTKSTDRGVVSKKELWVEGGQNRREQDECVVTQKARGKMLTPRGIDNRFEKEEYVVMQQKARGRMPIPNHASLFTPLSSSNIQRDHSASKTMTDELRRYHQDKGKVINTPTTPVLSFIDEDNEAGRQAQPLIKHETQEDQREAMKSHSEDHDRLHHKELRRLDEYAFSPQGPAETPSASRVVEDKFFLSLHTAPRVDRAASRAASEPPCVETGPSRQPELTYSKKYFEDPIKHAFSCSLSPVAEMEQASPVNLYIDDSSPVVEQKVRFEQVAIQKKAPTSTRDCLLQLGNYSSPVVEQKVRFEQVAVQKKVLTSTRDCLLQLGNILSGGSAKGTIHNAQAPEIISKEITEESASVASLQTQESETKKCAKEFSQTDGTRFQQSADIPSGDHVEDKDVDTRDSVADSQESWDSPMPTKEDDRIPPCQPSVEKDGGCFSCGEHLMGSGPNGALKLAAYTGTARKYATPIEKTGDDLEVDGIVVVHRHANVSRTTPYLMTLGGPKSSILRLQRKEGQKSSPASKHNEDGIDPGSGNSRKRNQSLLKKAPGTKPPLSSSKFDSRAASSGSWSELGHHTLLKSGVPSIVEFVSPPSPRHAHDGSDAESYKSPLRAGFAPISKKKKGSVAQQNSNEEEFSCTDDNEGSRQVPGYKTSQVIPSSQISGQSTGSRPDFDVYEAEAYSKDNGSTAPSYSNKSRRSGGEDLDFHSDTASHFGTEGWTDGLQPGSPKSSDSSTVAEMSSRYSSARNTLNDHTATHSSVSRTYSGKPFWTWRVLNPRLPLCSLQNLDALVSINQKKRPPKGRRQRRRPAATELGRRLPFGEGVDAALFVELLVPCVI